MGDPVAWLVAQLDADEQWALAASKPYPYAEGNPQIPAGGVHWTWVVGENWEPVTPDPVENEIVERDGDWNCNLATVEQWEWKSYGRAIEPGCMMRNTYASSIEEMDSAAAGHIVRHDPARVLAEVAAKRRIIERHPGATATDECPGCGAWLNGTWRTGPGETCPELADVAAPYADRPGFPEELRMQ